MTEEIVKYGEENKSIQLSPAMTPSDLLSILVQKGADLATLEKFLDLREREEKNQARKQYIKAISEFKKKPLEILKDRKVSFQTSKGTTEYDHASLANVVNVISAELSNHGLSASWKTDQGDFGIKVTCILRHVEGHSEEVSLTAPSDLSGNKNPIQAIASTVSYLERYTLLAITGLTTKDMDDDAAGVPEYITDEMQKEINDLIKSTKADKAKVLKYLKSESVEKILLSDYGKAKVAFEAKTKAEKKPMREPGEE